MASEINQKRLIYILIIIVLLVINAFLLYNNMQTRDEKELVQHQNIQLIDERDDLENDKTQLLAELDEMNLMLEREKGSNAEMNAKIEEMQNRLAELRKDLKNSESSNAVLRRELAKTKQEFERMKDMYIAEINVLKEEKTALLDTLTSKEIVITSLEDKIKRGEILSATGINAYGIRYRRNEREVTTDRANRTDKVMICFTLAENHIAEPGYKPLFLRIINPEGATMAVESLGSGTFEMAANGERSLYTKRITVNYTPDQGAREYCTDWTPNTGFAPGDYKIEIYQEGHLIGANTFSLKKGGMFN